MGFSREDVPECQLWLDFLGVVGNWASAIVDQCAKVERQVGGYTAAELRAWQQSQALLLTDGGAMSLDVETRTRLASKVASASLLRFGKKWVSSPAACSATIQNWLAANMRTIQRTE